MTIPSPEPEPTDYRRFEKRHPRLVGRDEIWVLCHANGEPVAHEHGEIQCATLDRVPFRMKPMNLNRMYQAKDV